MNGRGQSPRPDYAERSSRAARERNEESTATGACCAGGGVRRARGKSCSASESAEATRRCGSFTRQDMTSASSACGIEGLLCEGGKGEEDKILLHNAGMVSALNGLNPVSISYSTTPSE